MKKVYYLRIMVPTSHSDQVRDALGKAGAGEIGAYHFCTFSFKGIGRFLPKENANPYLGEIGSLCAVEEECIETVCEPSLLKGVLAHLFEVHPYETPSIQVSEIYLPEKKEAN